MNGSRCVLSTVFVIIFAVTAAQAAFGGDVPCPPGGAPWEKGFLRVRVFRTDPAVTSPDSAIMQSVFDEEPMTEEIVPLPDPCPGAYISALTPFGQHLTLFPARDSIWPDHLAGPFLPQPAEFFGAELRGFLHVTPEQAGLITFEFAADDVALLSIDGQEVVNPIWHATTTAVFNLQAGTHKFMFRMVEFGGGADIRLGWDAGRPGAMRMCVPADAFTPFPDCDGNGVSDACDPDCNGNGISDVCDILSGTSTDSDDTGIPDECEPRTRIVYVDADATGSNDGSSWENAFTSLGLALMRSDDMTVAGRRVQLWVAEGVYKPIHELHYKVPRTATFHLYHFVSLYGGFAGGETSLDMRDPAAHRTILSGDLLGNDGPDPTTRQDNCFHVVTAIQMDPSLVLDGFEITGGNANGSDEFPYYLDRGAGLLISGPWTHDPFSAGPRVSHCLFRDNRAKEYGGGACVLNAKPVFIACTFIGNRAGDSGGAFGSQGAQVNLVNCRFLGNESGWDGGAFFGIEGLAVLMNCLFSGNSADNDGGAISTLGTRLFLTNSTLTRNFADIEVGGLHDPSGMAQVTNCILWRNFADEGTEEQFQIEGIPGATAIDYSMVQGWTGALGGTENRDADPLFVDVEGPDGLSGTLDDNARLLSGSPAIDAGTNSFVPDDVFDLDGDGDTDELIPWDLDGHHRRVDDPAVPDQGLGTPPIVDRGAYEHVPGAAPCVLRREMPASFIEGVPVTVRLIAAPAGGVSAYAVEERVPGGWAVEEISDGGVFDAVNQKVKWGPFLDAQPRTLTYRWTPTAGAQGTYCLDPAVLSADGVSHRSCGQACIDFCALHPADTDANRRIGIDELTAYGACWRRGCAWPAPPNPIPVAFVTRAGYLWRNGEAYCCEFPLDLPLRWAPCTAGPVAAAPGEARSGVVAERSIVRGSRASVLAVTVRAKPPATAAAYALEETLPDGLIVTRLGAGGDLDRVARRIRWGPFLDGKPREFEYEVTVSTGAAPTGFAGVLSVDGVDRSVGGMSAVAASAADLDGDFDVDQNDFGLFQTCITGPSVAVGDAACGRTDFDHDGDVDQADFGVFQRCISGPGQSPPAGCAD